MDNSHMYDPCAVAVAVEHLKREQQDWSALAVTAALDEIARLGSKLADAIRERDEAIATAVWAVRNSVEAVGLPPLVSIFVNGNAPGYRSVGECDGTDADILRAVKEAMGDGK